MTHLVGKEKKERPRSGSEGEILLTVGFDLLQSLDDLKYEQNDSQPSGKRGHIWLLGCGFGSCESEFLRAPLSAAGRNNLPLMASLLLQFNYQTLR
jgi:hypothetical protein